MKIKPGLPQLILGHRGSPREAKENTLRSFALALDRGADGVELDIQRSRDRVPVVIHDDTLERTTTAKGRVSKLAWPAIERLTGAVIPSFAQVTAWAAARGAWLNVELKAPDTEEAVIALLRHTGLLDRTVISSFDPAIVRRAGDFDADIRRYLLTERWDDHARQALEAAQALGVCLKVDAADDTALHDLEERGLPVIVWTVNERAQVRRLLLAGVAAIISDDPKMAAEERNALLPR